MPVAKTTEHAELVATLANAMAHARREARFVGTAVPNYFRKPYGPGWALVGDAGYIKDFITAQGITDAFRDAEHCATALHGALSGSVPSRTRWHATNPPETSTSCRCTSSPRSWRFSAAAAQAGHELLAAVHGNPEAMDAFARVNAGVMSPAEFLSDENVERIHTAAAVIQPG